MTGLFERVRSAVSPKARLQRAYRQMQGDERRLGFPVVAKAAQRGDVEAQYRVGRAYLDGNGVPPSRAMAAQWLERAAQSGKIEAQATLAALYLTGAGAGHANTQGAGLFAEAFPGEPDFTQAVRWATPAAEAGSAEAQALLAYVMTSGPEALRDLPAADEWYRRSAAAGCAQGSLGHGLALLRHAATDEDRQAGAVEIAKAAEAKLPLGLYLLGVMTAAGTGVAADQAAASQLYRQAA